MAILFNESEVPPIALENGAARQPLLTAARVPGTQILLDRLTLAPGGETTLTVPAQSLAWFQLLQGEAVLGAGDTRQTITEAHVVFLPPAFGGAIGVRPAAPRCSTAKSRKPAGSIPNLRSTRRRSA